MTSPPELYDHDFDELDKVCKWLHEKQGTTTDLETFRRTAVEKFAEVGFRVEVKVWSTSEDGTFAFDIEVRGKCDPQPFDWDRQVHEVVNNYLKDPDAETGFIKTDFSKFEKPHTHN